MSHPAGLLVLVLALVISGTPGVAQELPESDHVALRHLQELSRRAVLDADEGAATALFEEDAVLMPPGLPTVVGRPDIEAFWRRSPQLEQFEIEVVEIGGAGDFAFVRGTYLMRLAGAPPETSGMRGKFLQVLRRQPDQRWLIRADMFSPDSQ